VSGGILIRRNVGGTETDAIQLSANGDISFYDDTGVTQGLFWDASTQRLGISTTSPGARLQVGGNAKLGSASATTFSGSLTTGGLDVMVGSGATSDGAFQVWDDNELTTPRFTVTREGNVGIGVVPPSAAVRGLYYAGGGVTYSTASTYRYDMVNAYFDTGWKYIGNGVATQIYQANGQFIFNQASSNSSGAGAALTWDEAARIDSSGNLLVGTTDTTVYDNNANSSADNGLNLRGDGKLDAARYNGIVLGLNLTGNDGTLAEFRKSGAIAGVIGVRSGNLQIGTDDVGLEFHDTDNTIYPANVTTQALPNGTISFGSASSRFNTVYAKYLDVFTGSTTADGLKISRYTPGNYYSTLRQDSHGLAIYVGTGGAVSERVAITPNGITFNGDTAAANALDDYEEGTWVPTIEGSTTNPSGISYGIQDGTYTKIGRMVYVMFRVSFAFTAGTGAGNLVIAGLPVASTIYAQPKSPPQHDNLSFTGFEYLEMSASSSTATIGLAKNRSGSSASSLTLSDCNAASTDINGGVFYFMS